MIEASEMTPQEIFEEANGNYRALNRAVTLIEGIQRMFSANCANQRASEGDEQAFVASREDLAALRRMMEREHNVIRDALKEIGGVK